MLYVFQGTDIGKGRDKAGALVTSLRTKRPDATFVPIDADNWSASLVEEHIGGQGLFSNKYIVFLDRVTENRIAKEELVDLVPAMKDSANIFIVLEAKVLVDLKKTFDKYAEKVLVCDEKDTNKNSSKAKKTEEFNIFALADAVGARDPLKSWMIYRQAVDGGLEPENIIGTLFWQAKSMVLSRNSTNAVEAGLSPFVFSKSRRYASNYSEGELSEFLKQLTVIYHDGHRGIKNIELAVERLLLGLR